MSESRSLSELDDLLDDVDGERPRLWCASPETERFLKHGTPVPTHPLFYLYREPGFGWFRVFGCGLAWKDSRRHPLLFSERHGFSAWRIGRWVVRRLP